jgi:methionyl-tRNA synthetase
MKKRLVTSALPYVNNIPHLGNLIQVLSADVFARFSRQRGYETLYVCGSDEYGTATETRAREEGVSPRELCDRNHAIHRDIYSWFNIEFDHYGRTSTTYQTEIVQGIFKAVYEAGYITQRSIKQLYSEKSEMFLADRYVKGECPHCHYDDARGDQCENCGKLLDPEHLINPVSIMDNSTPVLKETTHLYIDLPKILPLLQQWMDEASARGRWARNAVQMTQAWIRDGLKERAITRDLKWGIPVPLEGFEDKVFYVWFDAPIGYISISAEHAALSGDGEAWKSWWHNPEEVELFQFIGKDNIPFHTVIFPSSLLATGANWTMLHHMSSSEYMNYEAGKFSKSKGVGVFGNDAQNTGIPADVWRFYIFYNRPETSDYVFTWKDFQEKTNKELIGNLANLVNRTLSFTKRFYDGEIISPDLTDPSSADFWTEVKRLEGEITGHLEWGPTARRLPQDLRPVELRQQGVPGIRALEIKGKRAGKGKGGPFESGLPGQGPGYPDPAVYSIHRRSHRFLPRQRAERLECPGGIPQSGYPSAIPRYCSSSSTTRLSRTCASVFPAARPNGRIGITPMPNRPLTRRPSSARLRRSPGRTKA